MGQILGARSDGLSKATPSKAAETLAASPDGPMPDAVAIEAGTLFAGKYQIEREIARGGIGIVLAATHVQLDRRVAIKYLQPRALASKPTVDRFTREAQLSAKIRSEHIVRVHDVGTADGVGPYMVMEFLEGKDLAKTLDDGPLPIATAVDYVLQACEALAEAHALGIIHRDLKPENLFLAKRAGGQSTVKIIDFGVSKVAPKRGEAGAWTHMTTANECFGTPVYMSPEQLRSTATVDLRTDIWALGVSLFELLTGEMPFVGDDLPQLCTSIVTEAPRRLTALRPDAPGELDAVLLRCLEKDPARRYRNVAELAEDLASFASPSARLGVEQIRRVTLESGASIRPPSPSASAIVAHEPSEARTLLKIASGDRKRLVTIASLVAVAVIGGAILVRARSEPTAQAPVLRAPPPPDPIPVQVVPTVSAPLPLPSQASSSRPPASPAPSTPSATPAAAKPRPAPKPRASDYAEFGERR